MRAAFGPAMGDPKAREDDEHRGSDPEERLRRGIGMDALGEQARCVSYRFVFVFRGELGRSRAHGGVVTALERSDERVELWMSREVLGEGREAPRCLALVFVGY